MYGLKQSSSDLNALSSMECMIRLEHSIAFSYIIWIKESVPWVVEIVSYLVRSVNGHANWLTGFLSG